jgi:L-type amino acid transporter 9
VKNILVNRVCYVAGQDGLMIKSLSFVHFKRLTPSPAVVSQGVLSFIFIILGDIVQLIEVLSFLIWIFYGMAMVSLLVLRKTKKHAHRPYRVRRIKEILHYLSTFIRSYYSRYPHGLLYLSY